MVDKFKGIPVIDDDAPDDLLYPPGMSTGLVPRDLTEDPPEMFEPPSDMQLIPESEWDARIKEQDEQESSLEHIYLRAGWPHLDQDGYGYCWSHSTTHAVMLDRAAKNQPHVPLSAFAVAAIIKNYRDQGGWCGQSAKFIQEVGVPSQKLWPQKKVDRSLDTPEMRADAAKHRIVEEWRDLTRPIHGQAMTFAQLASALFNNQPAACDFNWWGHSVCGVRIVKIEDGSYGLLILNSWRNWGRQGLGILRGSKSRPDGAIAIRSTTGG